MGIVRKGLRNAQRRGTCIRGKQNAGFFKAQEIANRKYKYKYPKLQRGLNVHDGTSEGGRQHDYGKTEELPGKHEGT